MEYDLCNSSIAKMHPAIGALKAAASPAAAPAVIIYFISSGGLFKILPTNLALAPPICIEGPSLPRENPIRFPRLPPTIFEIIVGHSSILNFPKISPRIWGIPLPPERGAHFNNRFMINEMIMAIIIKISIDLKSKVVYKNFL